MQIPTYRYNVANDLKSIRTESNGAENEDSLLFHIISDDDSWGKFESQLRGK